MRRQPGPHGQGVYAKALSPRQRGQGGLHRPGGWHHPPICSLLLFSFPPVSFDWSFPMSQQTFTVQGMSCSHCERAVTQAVQALDPQAQVKIDLASGRVDVDSHQAADAIQRAIEQEGYTVSA
jgi:copper chaperone